jgi:hypothetical protein
VIYLCKCGLPPLSIYLFFYLILRGVVYNFLYPSSFRLPLLNPLSPNSFLLHHIFGNHVMIIISIEKLGLPCMCTGNEVEAHR